MLDITSYILSKKYIEDSLAGAGALAGKSAYEIAMDNGFSGGPTEWLNSLKGDTPQIGPAGTWVISGVDTGVIASPSLAGYATEEFVNQQIADIPEVDLSPYATRQELSEAILGIVIPDVSGFATKEELEAAIAAIKFPEPDLTPYATKKELEQAISEIPSVDLTPYAKKEEIPSIDGLASEEYVQEQIENIEIPEVDLTPYAKKDEIPNVSEFVTAEYVAQKIAEAELADKEVDLSSYSTKTETDEKIADAINALGLTQYITEEELEQALNEIQIPSTDGLATEEYVQEQIAQISIPSTEGLATEQYVDEAIAAIEHPTVDLTPYAKKEDIPSIKGLASEDFVVVKFSELINSAPETLDTLGEIALALGQNQEVVDTLNDAIGNKADKSYVDKAISEIDIPETDLTGYATEDFVTDAISNIEIPSVKPANIYELESDSVIITDLIALLPTNAEINQGDMMLVSNSLGVKSAYQFDEDWIACDGNVDASKVIMPFDITLAGSYTQVGNLSKTSTGTATFATKGKSVAAALQEMLSKREQPKIVSNPSVTLSATSGAKEVGTVVTPTWLAALNTGKYTYGPATGITASTWEISDTNGNTASTVSGEFSAFTVGDSTNYRISAKATYEAGAIAQDNLGDPSNPTVQIPAGSKSANGGYITGYRAWFTYVGTNVGVIDSDFIRASDNEGSSPTTQNNVAIPAGTKRVMVAIPATSSLKLTSVIDVDGMGLDVFGNFTLYTINVEGLNGYEAKPYNVWVADNENGMAATHYNLIIS